MMNPKKKEMVTPLGVRWRRAKTAESEVRAQGWVTERDP